MFQRHWETMEQFYDQEVLLNIRVSTGFALISKHLMPQGKIQLGQDPTNISFIFHLVHELVWSSECSIEVKQYMPVDKI
jgi:hypothetical protein